MGCDGYYCFGLLAVLETPSTKWVIVLSVVIVVGLLFRRCGHSPFRLAIVIFVIRRLVLIIPLDEDRWTYMIILIY